MRIPTLPPRSSHAVPRDVDLMVDFTRREVVAGALDEVLAADALATARLFVTGNVEALRLLRGLSGRARIGLTWTEGRRPSPGPARTSWGRSTGTPAFGFADGRARRRRRAPRLGASCRPGPWTAPEDMAHVVADGVDAVVSNRIAALVAHLGR